MFKDDEKSLANVTFPYKLLYWSDSMSESQQGPEICDVISAKRYYTWFLKSRVTEVFSLEVKKYVSEILYF